MMTDLKNSFKKSVVKELKIKIKCSVFIDLYY